MARSQGDFSRAFAQSQVRTNHQRGLRNDSDEDVLVGKDDQDQGQGHIIVLTRDVEVLYGDVDVDARAKERGSGRV